MSANSKGIEEKMQQLRGLVAWFESDDFILEQASSKFEEATKLAGEIEHDLAALKNTVTVLKQSFEEK